MRKELERARNGIDSLREAFEKRKGLSVAPEIYEIKVEGLLDSQWSEWFDGWSIVLEGDRSTLITGPVTDQPALYGVLAKIRNLNLTLVSLHRIEPNQKGGHETI